MPVENRHGKCGRLFPESLDHEFHPEHGADGVTIRPYVGGD